MERTNKLLNRKFQCQIFKWSELLFFVRRRSWKKDIFVASMPRSCPARAAMDPMMYPEPVREVPFFCSNRFTGMNFAYCIVEYIRSRMLMMQNTMYMNVYDIWKYLKSAAILIPIFDCRHSGLQVWRVQVLQVHLSVSQSALKSSQHQAKHCRTKNHSNDRIHLAKQCQTVWTDWQSVQLYYLISSQSLHIINI